MVIFLEILFLLPIITFGAYGFTQNALIALALFYGRKVIVSVVRDYIA